MPFEFEIIFAPLILMILDIAFGYLGAMRLGNLNSTIMREGLWNKVTELLIIAAGFAGQYCLNVFGQEALGMQVNIPISTGICAYLCIYELTSIVENVGKFDYNLALKFVKLFGIEPSKMGLVEKDSTEVNEDD